MRDVINGRSLNHSLFFFGQPTVCNGLRIIIGFLTNGERIAARALYARTHHLSQLPAPYRLQRDLETLLRVNFDDIILLATINLPLFCTRSHIVDHTNSPDSSPDFYLICLFDNHTNIHLIDNQSFSFLLK